jgi:hypothetical protein
MSIATSLARPAIPDSFALALRYATAPYAQGSATLALALGPAKEGASKVLPYDFSAYQNQYGVQTQTMVVSYVLTLLVDQLSGPATVDIGYVTDSGPRTASLLVPSGSLAGTGFAVAPLPNDPSLIIKSLVERPAPVADDPSGPAKWSLTALLGNFARLLWVLTGESQTLAAIARDVRAQVHLATARGASLDRIGDGVGVPRLLPAPYRLNFDLDTVALYHLGDAIAPVLDETPHEYPGVNIGATRGLTGGRFGKCCQITAAGGLIIPDAHAFAIDPMVGFTVEMFAELTATPRANETVVFAVKRPRFDQTDSPGWSLALEPSGSGHDLVFALTDTTGNVVRAVAPNPALPAGWFHVAGVVNPATKEAVVYLNGVAAAPTSLGALGVVETGADIGLGADRVGAAHLEGSLDEVRFSNTARTDFSTVLGPGGRPYAVDPATIALYHLDEDFNWIDEDSGRHYAINASATPGVRAHFDGGLLFSGDPLPTARCASELKFQSRLRSGEWDHTAGGAVVAYGPYARFGYIQGAIKEPGLRSTPEPVLVNDLPVVDARARGLMTTACYGFAPTDPAHPNAPSDPSQTIDAFHAAGRSVQEAIDYFGEWFGLGDAYFKNQYQLHKIPAAYETCQSASATASSVLIPPSADFAFDETTSFTIEAFIRPDAITDHYARAVAASRSSGLRPGEANPGGEAGWALCLGLYHSIPNNLRWVVGDAKGNLVTVDANINLADGAFHHVAGVIDRGGDVALLFVDGVEVNQSPLGSLGGMATADPITLGNSPALNAPYPGLIDEVRISKTARRLFQPVLGEGDDRYRQRLAIYQPWRLPTFPTILRGVQALTLCDATRDVTGLLLGSDPIPASLIQFGVDETDSTRFCASAWLRVIPKRLGLDVRLVAWGNGSGFPSSGNSLVIVGLDNNGLLHIRIFDGDGNLVTDTDETNLPGTQAGAISNFKQQLPGLLPPHELTSTEKDQVISDATSIVGQTQFAANQSLSADGTSRANEPAVTALTSLPANYPGLLTEPPGANFQFANAQSQVMVLATARALERLAARLSSVAPTATLNILSAYAVAPPAQAGQPAPVTNDGLGLALTLTLASPIAGLDLGVLGALAFETGVAYVAYQNGPGASSLRIVVGRGADLELDATGMPNPGRDEQGRQIATINQPLTISITRPTPQTIRGQAPNLTWVVLACGHGAGTLTAVAGDDTTMTFLGTALGQLIIEVRYLLLDGVTTLVGSLPIVIAQESMDACDVLGGDGTPNVTEAATAGTPADELDFQADYLIPTSVPGVDYAPHSPASNLMQLPLEAALTRLAELAGKEPGAPRITVLSAYDPSQANLQAVGRGMLVGPAAADLTVGRLGALAFLAGFDYIERRRYSSSVYVSVAAGDRFEIITRPIRRLWPNAGISGRGDQMATEFEAAGPPDPGFNPGTLVAFSDPRVTFAAGVSDLVQPVLQQALSALVTAITADGVSGTLQVTGGYTAGDPTLRGVGRALLLRHSSVAADRLSGYVLQAGFGFVRHRTLDPGGPSVYAAAYPSSGSPPDILTDPESTYINVYLDTLIELAIRPQLPVKGQLEWCVVPTCPASADLTSAAPDPSDPHGITEKVFQGTAPGTVAAIAAFSLNDAADPYQFLLAPATPETGDGRPCTPMITKDQYDDVLNFLYAYHPVGVEGVTRAIRAYVHGFKRPPRWDRIPTAATFPSYRVPR